jgi:hypothetical protein
MSKLFTAVLLLIGFNSTAQDGVLHIVFTSDVHYGIFRTHFRNGDSVPSTVVNQGMIQAVNRLAGQVGAIDALVITGDIANREENGVQSAAMSWHQFEDDWAALDTHTSQGDRTPLWLLPGNHDVSDAIGFHRPMKPKRDASSMAGIYNYMLHPAVARTKESYDYNRDKVHYKKDIGGVHMLFLNLWPDSSERAWMDKDLDTLKPGTPVLLFAHSIPDVEARFFTNPNRGHAIDSTRFENLLPEWFHDGASVGIPALDEQRGFVAWLKKHPSVRAYFHGHNNNNEFYQWHGPDNDISLPCFRVDSPMKGKYSAHDETLLSFQLLTIDPFTQTITVRECLWNSVPSDASVLKWGDTTTLSLHP